MQVTMEPLVLLLLASSLPPSDGHNPNSNSKQRAASLTLPSHGNGDVAACCDSDIVIGDATFSLLILMDIGGARLIRDLGIAG